MNIEEINERCSEAINNYIFQKIWNEPHGTFRQNIKPIPITNGSVVGSFSTRDGNIQLPKGGGYYVYAISATDFYAGLYLPVSTWIDTSELINRYHTFIHFYDSHGSMVQKNSVYLRYNRSRTTIFIAVKKPALLAATVSSNRTNMYFTVYYDSDLRNKIHHLGLHITSERKINSAALELKLFLQQYTTEDSKPEQLQCFINGYEVDTTEGLPELKIDNFYDFIIDENILFSFDVDLVTEHENPAFLSDQDKAWKQLIHIPRDKNPDNLVITHDTCDFYLRRKLDNKGLYVHRLAELGIGQVTHNDFSIPLYIVDSYRDYMSSQLLTAHVVVRNHSKNNYLVRDASYIDMLYVPQHDDKTIIKILTGHGPADIPWWKATNLEKSPFVHAMFDAPNYASIDKLQQYVDILGYYNTIAIICERIVDTTITDAFAGKIDFGIPVLYYGRNIYPIVYLNGKYVYPKHYRYHCYPSLIEVEFDKDLYIRQGDQLTVIMHLDEKLDIVHDHITENHSAVKVPFDNEIVFAIYDTNTDIPNLSKRPTSMVYRKLEHGEGHFFTKIIDGVKHLVFDQKYRDTQVVIVPKYKTYVNEVVIDDIINKGDTIAIPLTTYHENLNIPVLHMENIAVYMNGNYLVQGIDYILSTVKQDNDIAYTELVIQTMDHFKKDTTNTVQYVINIEALEDTSNGFSRHDYLWDKTPLNLYFPEISTTHVGGVIRRDISNTGIVTYVPNSGSGNKFEIATAIPDIVTKYVLDKISGNEDRNRIITMNKYFGNLEYPPQKIHKLARKNRIYSIVMNEFIRDVLNGKITIAIDPDVTRMEETMKPYLVWKDKDIVYSDINKAFVDFYPQYANYEIPPELKTILDAYIKKFLPDNEAPSVEVVYGNKQK